MSNWIEICELSEIHPNTGVCALVNEEQVAVFRFKDSEEVFAISNFDPIGKANVLSRGLMAQLGENLTVASPLYKQHYDLRTGECLEDESVSVTVFGAKVDGGKVLVQAA